MKLQYSSTYQISPLPPAPFSHSCVFRLLSLKHLEKSSIHLCLLITNNSRNSHHLYGLLHEPSNMLSSIVMSYLLSLTAP